jgi:hypothetical protein
MTEEERVQELKLRILTLPSTSLVTLAWRSEDGKQGSESLYRLETLRKVLEDERESGKVEALALG